jgi:hypothetical protein
MGKRKRATKMSHFIHNSRYMLKKGSAKVKNTMLQLMGFTFKQAKIPGSP